MFYPKSDNGLRSETDLWDIAGKKMAGVLPSSQNGRVSLDGQKRFVYEYPVFFTVYDTKTGQKLSDQPMAPDGSLTRYDISPDLSLLATCNKQLGENPVKIWDISTGELVKTLPGKWGRCGLLMFSPDGRLLLRFDEHGAGPVIWEVAGWKVVQANFVKSKDLFVDILEFSQDGSTVLVDTFNRLTLYGLPPGSLGTPEAAASAASPAAVTTAAPRPVLSCDITVQGALKLHVQPCLPPSTVSAGGYDGQSVSISITDSNYTGVFIENIPFDQVDIP
jgi:WD40 repeat protein